MEVKSPFKESFSIYVFQYFSMIIQSVQVPPFQISWSILNLGKIPKSNDQKGKILTTRITNAIQCFFLGVDKNQHQSPSPWGSAESTEAPHLLQSFLSNLYLVFDTVHHRYRYHCKYWNWYWYRNWYWPSSRYWYCPAPPRCGPIVLREMVKTMTEFSPKSTQSRHFIHSHRKHFYWESLKKKGKITTRSQNKVISEV